MRRYGLAKMPYARATLYADAIRTLARRRTLMGAYASRDPVRRRAPYADTPRTLTRRTLTRPAAAAIHDAGAPERLRRPRLPVHGAGDVSRRHSCTGHGCVDSTHPRVAVSSNSSATAHRVQRRLTIASLPLRAPTVLPQARRQSCDTDARWPHNVVTAAPRAVYRAHFEQERMRATRMRM
jgi:hypothetical protein